MSLSDLGLAPIEITGIEDQELRNRLIEALMEVNDPEINIDIINLGLVYEINMDPEKNVEVKMTLTAIGCPLAGTITGQVSQVLGRVPDVNEVKVDVVWNPPWDRARVSKIAAIQLGIR